MESQGREKRYGFVHALGRDGRYLEAVDGLFKMLKAYPEEVNDTMYELYRLELLLGQSPLGTDSKDLARGRIKVIRGDLDGAKKILTHYYSHLEKDTELARRWVGFDLDLYGEGRAVEDHMALSAEKMDNERVALADLLRSRARYDEAFMVLTQGQDLEFASSLLLVNAASTAFDAKRYAETIEICRIGIEKYPAGAGIFYAWWGQSLAEMKDGSLSAAFTVWREGLRKGKQLGGDAWIASSQIYLFLEAIYYNQGNVLAALQTLEEYREMLRAVGGECPDLILRRMQKYKIELEQEKK